MKVALNTWLVAHPGLFKQVIVYLGGMDLTSLLKVNLNEFAEAARIVVFESFRITKGLQ